MWRHFKKCWFPPRTILAFLGPTVLRSAHIYEWETSMFANALRWDFSPSQYRAERGAEKPAVRRTTLLHKPLSTMAECTRDLALSRRDKRRVSVDTTRMIYYSSLCVSSTRLVAPHWQSQSGSLSTLRFPFWRCTVTLACGSGYGLCRSLLRCSAIRADWIELQTENEWRYSHMC
jgi:hypothetical protein